MKKIYLILCLISLFSCSNKNNHNKLLLISLDGYRWDFTQKFSPPFLTKFKKDNTSLKSLIPTYPTKTFPNHLSIVTGSYPMNHGIISNHFYSPDIQKVYSLKNRESVENPDFYQAIPIWGLLEKNNIKTATYFWPGSEAPIKGISPSIFKLFNKETPNQTKIEEVLNWLKREDENAPRFMTIYFSDVDSAGHRFGPNSPEVKKAVLDIDSHLLNLISNAQKISPDLDIIIVSDHGMQELVPSNIEQLFKTENEVIRSLYYIIGDGPISHLYKKENVVTDINSDIEKINMYAKNFTCHHPLSTPKELHFHQNPSIGDIVCIAKNKWNIALDKDKKFNPGSHGWSQYETKDMDAIFYAGGPSFKNNFEYESLDNIHIFPLIAYLFDVKITESIDGDFSKIKEILKEVR